MASLGWQNFNNTHKKSIIKIKKNIYISYIIYNYSANELKQTLKINFN